MTLIVGFFLSVWTHLHYPLLRSSYLELISFYVILALIMLWVLSTRVLICCFFIASLPLCTLASCEPEYIWLVYQVNCSPVSSFLGKLWSAPSSQLSCHMIAAQWIFMEWIIMSKWFSSQLNCSVFWKAFVDSSLPHNCKLKVYIQSNHWPTLY